MILTLALLVVLITALPYFYGYITAPAGAIYTGLHYLTPGDTNVFLSMIEQARQGDNVFINLYTAEPQHRLFINPLWLSVGWLAKIFSLSNLLALHLARSIWILIFVFVVYLFLSYFFRRTSWRKWALIFILFSSGAGVFFNPFFFDLNNMYERPVDVWVPESITFLTLYHSPHLIASLTLIILIFLLMLLAFDNNKFRYSLAAGLACLILLWFHPFNGPTIYAVLAVYLLVIFFRQKKIDWRRVKHYAVLCVVPLPALLYYYLISQADWAIRQWSAQNVLPSPSVRMYLTGYGFLLLLAIFGLWITRKKFNQGIIFLFCWTVTSGLLLYSPISFQRRLSEGLHIPLAVLAAVAALYLLKKINKGEKSMNLKAIFLIMVLSLFLPLTNFQMWGQDIYLYHNKKNTPYYLYDEEVVAMRWLKDNLTKEEIIFSSYYMGNFIPAYSGRIVWIGHGPQTINLSEKKEISEWFWQSDVSAAEKYELLKQAGADYLFYGRQEKKLGKYDPATKEYLEEVFANSQAQIYRVL